MFTIRNLAHSVLIYSISEDIFVLLYLLVDCITRDTFGFNFTRCGYDFKEEMEETNPQFCNQWKRCEAGGILSIYPQYWRYHTESSDSFSVKGRLNSYPGGGYVVDIGSSKVDTDNVLFYLQRKTWLDDFTRAVTIDFTVYNTQSNFYTMVLFLLEIPANGGGFTFKQILSTRLDRYSSGFAVFLAVCEITFLCFSVYYLVREFKKWRVLKARYFTKWENWVELCSFSLIWASFSLLIIRLGVVNSTKAKYLRAPKTFIDFDTSAWYDQLYGYTLACLVFILFIKFLKLLRFNRKMSLMFRTVSHASVDTKYFSFSFVIVIAAFSQFAHLIFMSSIFEYSNMIYTLESLINMMLGSFSYSDMVEAAPEMGKLFFFTYFTFMTFILLNMFISIINESFSIVQEHTRELKNKYELVDFLKQRLGGFLPHFMTRKKRKSLVEESKIVEEDIVETSLIEPVAPESCQINEPSLHKISESAPIEKRKVRFVDEKLIVKGLPAIKACKKRIKRCEVVLDELDDAVDRISIQVESMIRDEEAEERLWEYLVELIRIKYSIQNSNVGRGKERAVKVETVG